MLLVVALPFGLVTPALASDAPNDPGEILYHRSTITNAPEQSRLVAVAPDATTFRDLAEGRHFGGVVSPNGRWHAETVYDAVVDDAHRRDRGSGDRRPAR